MSLGKMAFQLVFMDSNGCSIEDTDDSKASSQTIDLGPYCRGNEELRCEETHVQRIGEGS